MSSNQHVPTIISFGPFKADLHTHELRKQGLRLRLPGQSFQILEMLLKRPGELVTREELQQALWPSDTHVDFERGVNAAVNRLREALTDSADSPHLIETLPRRGYRFIGTVDQAQVPATAGTPLTPTILENVAVAAPGRVPPGQENRLARSRITAFKIMAVVFAAVVILVVAVLYRRPLQDTLPVTPLPFTALQGLEVNPTFSPDGTQIAFGWNGGPAGEGLGFDLYVKVVGSEELLRLTRHPSRVISPAWSPDGTQIAFHRIDAGGLAGIYLIPVLGGSERRLRATTSPSGLIPLP